MTRDQMDEAIDAVWSGTGARGTLDTAARRVFIAGMRAAAAIAEPHDATPSGAKLAQRISAEKIRAKADELERTP
jgi:cysteine synthase